MEGAMRVMLKSKVHRARVTEVDVNYEGSIAIDKRLMAEADILPYEQVHVVNVNNGARFETYAIEAEAGSGTIGIRGAAARLAAVGDIIIILTYRHVNEEDTLNYHPTLVYVDENNVITRSRRAVHAMPF
jgi:aspartate 1-decarboxylase